MKKEETPYLIQFMNKFLFIVSLPTSWVNINELIHYDYSSFAFGKYMTSIILSLAPIYFYSEIQKYKFERTIIKTTTNKIYKCRVQGTDEVFYVKADTEEEVELFFQQTMDGKSVFIEDADIKLLGFDMAVPNKTD